MSHPFGRAQPEITSVVVEDDVLLGQALDELFKAEPEYRKLTRKILRAQRRLRRLVTKEAFLACLDIEAATNTRVTFMLDLVAKWAFREGRRHQHHPGRR